MKTRVSNLAGRFGRIIAARRVVTAAGFMVLVGLTAWTAIMAKEARTAPALLDVREEALPTAQPQGGPETMEEDDAAPVMTAPMAEAPGSPATLSPELQKLCSDPSVRWFNGRPVKPSRTITMTVTAYSPDAKSCGESADGITATLHSVETNVGHLVAADPTLLPYGSMLSVEGYAGGQVVPVLDCGGAIKGKHIDLLFPTHEQARQWGVKKIRVTVWKYVDGKPAENPRKMR